MVEPEAVAAMLRLKEAGWGTKRRIGHELGVIRTTVKRYVSAEGWQPFKKPERGRLLDGHGDWLKERFHHHRGNAVMRQELLSEKGIAERAVEPYRQELEAEARATVRFETTPVHKLAEGRRQRILDPAHLAGVAGADGPVAPHLPEAAAPPALPPSLARPLAEYEALAGGAF